MLPISPGTMNLWVYSLIYPSVSMLRTAIRPSISNLGSKFVKKVTNKPLHSEKMGFIINYNEDTWEK